MTQRSKGRAFDQRCWLRGDGSCEILVFGFAFSWDFVSYKRRHQTQKHESPSRYWARGESRRIKGSMFERYEVDQTCFVCWTLPLARRFAASIFLSSRANERCKVMICENGFEVGCSLRQCLRMQNNPRNRGGGVRRRTLADVGNLMLAAM